MCIPVSHYLPGPRCSFGNPKQLLDTLTPTGPIPVSVKLSHRPDPWPAFLTTDRDALHGWSLLSKTPDRRDSAPPDTDGRYCRVRYFSGVTRLVAVTRLLPVCPYAKGTPR